MKRVALLTAVLLSWSAYSGIDSTFSDYLARSLGHHHRDFGWRPTRRFVDATHVHQTYQLYYRGRRVLDSELKLHYNLRAEFLEYATNQWERPFEVDLARDTGKMREELLARWQSLYSTSQANGERAFRGTIDAEPVIFLDEGMPVAAFEVKLSAFDRNITRHFIEEEGTGRILEERGTFRNVTVSSRAWKVSPFQSVGANEKAPSVESLPGLLSATSLKNGYFYVRREQGYTGTKSLVDLDPNPSTGDFAITTDPDSYNFQCTGSASQCPNQRVDGTNVYFHLNGFRDVAQGYLANKLQVSPIPMAEYEPIDVLINALSVDVDRDGDLEDETNNAGYFPNTCTSTGGTAIPRCIIFLRPKKGSSVLCGDGEKKFFDLAREAMVIVHEYQHFIIDTIVQLVAGSGKKNVGDALHEGFADYFAASHVSDIAGTDVTKIGEYGFQECTFFQRDIGTIRVYQNGAAETDEHVAGQSWASGLWQLRKELGREKVDLISFKSIFFLSTKPGFFESVEALVKADAALYNGANAARIRQLFYEEVKWIGGDTTFFKEPSTGVVDVGFTSCNAVRTGVQGTPSILVAMLWLLSVIFGTRTWRRGRGE